MSIQEFLAIFYLKFNCMNILYIHGLDSKLSDEKREILERFGRVYAPDINYYENKNAISSILDYYPEVEIDIVMGSSMGGFAGYHVADKLERPALLFNPALEHRSVEQYSPGEFNSYSKLKYIVLGQKDEVISPRDTLDYLMNNLNPLTHLHLHLVPRMGHNIPVQFFEEEVSAFFDSLKQAGTEV